MVFSILSYFTIPKSHFINYTIPFYNTLNLPKLYYFTILLKYYFLIFLYYFFPTFIFFKFKHYSNSHFFQIQALFQQTHFLSSSHKYFFPTIIYLFNHLHFFFCLRKKLPNINVLKLVNFKNPHTYIFHQTCQISI